MDTASLFQQAFDHHHQGRLPLAKAGYEQVLALEPGHADALNLLGTVALQEGSMEAAVQLFERAIRRYEEAIDAQPAQAQDCQAVLAQARLRYGNALRASGRLHDALENYERSIALDPTLADALANRGVALQELGRLPEAVAAYESAIGASPRSAGTHANLGAALRELDRPLDAVAACDRAIALEPGHAGAHCNRGAALQQLNRHEEAIASYDRAAAHEPAMAEAHYNKSHSLLALGRLAEGWGPHEWRWKATRTPLPAIAAPRWRGAEHPAGRTMLLACEQGMGDNIQFIRYATLVHDLGAKVLVAAPRALARLFEDAPGVEGVVTGEPPPCDFWCPLLSLPLAFATGAGTIPCRVPYLRAREADSLAWAGRLGTRTRPRVGLAWSGSDRHPDDRNRSIPLAEFVRGLPPAFEYVSLQKEVREADRALVAAHGIRHFGEQLRDYADTAALCELTDAVVSVDTSVAHLAGALGRPTWILLPHAADWRWQVERSDSPWYPTATLLRQGADRAWEPVLRELARVIGADPRWR